MNNKIATLRKKAGLTQEELAAKCGVTRQTIIALEQNRYNPSLQLAHDITKTLGRKSIEQVFELE